MQHQGGLWRNSQSHAIAMRSQRIRRQSHGVGEVAPLPHLTSSMVGRLWLRPLSWLPWLSCFQCSFRLRFCCQCVCSLFCRLVCLYAMCPSDFRCMLPHMSVPYSACVQALCHHACYTTT